MSNIRPFQVFILAVFGLLAIAALVFLSLYKTEAEKEEFEYGEKVTVWGSLPQELFKQTFQDVARQDKEFNVVEYREIAKENFDNELVNAIAEGRSPDLVVLQSESLVRHRAKLLPIPYETLSQRDFKTAFIDAAELFMLEEGIYGLPFAVDPIVMYWNRDMFASNGLAQPPKSWEALVSEVVPSITVRDNSRNVLKSAVAFGEFRNVSQGKNVLMLLALQTGSKMIMPQERGYKVGVNEPIVEGARAPLESALQFFTDFSNVNSPLYTWNRAMQNDKTAFLAGDLSLYFGFGSEYVDISNKNPNLNFDVAMVPQGASATALRTYGSVYAFAIPKASQNIEGAFSVARVLSAPENAQGLVSRLNMSSARRDLIAQGDENLYRKVILESALIARSWYDPNPVESDSIFMKMVEDVVSNRLRISEAVDDAIDRLTLAF